jgi:hypothetical protein
MYYVTRSVRKEVTTGTVVTRCQGLVALWVDTLLYFALIVRKMEKGRG